jgi:hypothetical protein
LLQTIGAFLCFTNLLFTKNNRSYLKHYVAFRSFFCSQMCLFYSKNSFRCFKWLIYLICTQIIYVIQLDLIVPLDFKLQFYFPSLHIFNSNLNKL